MKVIIVDDEQIAIEVLENQLKEIEGLEVVGKFKEPMEVLKNINDLEVDVVFLDMEMGKIHGLELAEILLRNISPLEIVFVTAYSEFALEAFEINAIDYLLKPVNQKRLLKTMEKLTKRIVNRKPHIEEIQKNDKELYIQVMEIFRIFDCNGNEIKWRTKKTKELFIYLWHHRNTGVNRSQIILDLWPDLFEEKAIALLHTTIYQLRKAMRDIDFENPVVLTNERYVLNIPLKSDLDDLKSIIASTDIKKMSVERANDLYPDDYLEVEGYEWALLRQEKIRSLFLDYLESYVLKVKHKEEQEDKFIEGCLKRMLQLEPYKIQYISLLLDFYGETRNMQKIILFMKKTKKKWSTDLGLELPKEIVDLYNKYIQF